MDISDFIEIRNYYKKPGQSGKLCVAVDGKGKKYLLKKGEYGEPANEYVYSLIAKQVGVSCQTCHLVEGFGYPVVAFEYIQSMPVNRKQNFDYDSIVDDLIKSRALDALTWQDDNLQYIISTDGKFYKIDNSEALGFSKFEEYLLTVNTTNINEERLNQIENDVERVLSFINIHKRLVIEKYGVEKIKVFESVLNKVLETDFNFFAQDKQLAKVYSKETYKYFLARITAMKKAIGIYFINRNKLKRNY